MRFDASITTRIPRSLRTELDRLARERGITPLALARTFVEEGIRRERHPGITFRTGPTGRRACIEGRRLDVWQVIETVRESRDIEEAADYLRLRPAQVRAAVDYWSQYPREIEDRIQRNREVAEEAEASARRRQQLLTG